MTILARCTLPAVALLAVVWTGLAQAGVAAVNPLPTDRQWIRIGSNHCFFPSTNGAPTCPAGGTASGFIDPATQHAHPTFQASGVSVLGGGSTEANALRIFIEASRGFSFAGAVIADTYTLAGPAGTVSLSATLTAEATVTAIPASTGDIFSSVNIGIAIGQGINPGGSGVAVQLASDSLFTNLVTTTPLEIDLAVEHAFDVTVGTPFNLAHHFATTNAGGIRVDGLSTATIGFTLPDGYSLTSVLGFQSEQTGGGATGVSAPAGLGLLAFATGALAALRRRRR